MSEITFRLNSPLTEEDWNLITDAEFEHSDSVTFTTPSGKEVEFRKVVRGEWIDTDPSQPLDPRVTCSICGNTEVLFKGNFCTNCGADMRGGRNERE